MKLSQGKRQYIRAHYGRYNDAKLAKALEVDKGEVRRVRKKLKLERTKEDFEWIRGHAHETPPEYTAQVPEPQQVTKLGKYDYATALAAAMVALVVYIQTLPPTVTAEDAGELITAAYTLGWSEF